jgi:hypothetical protein
MNPSDDSGVGIAACWALTSMADTIATRIGTIAVRE